MKIMSKCVCFFICVTILNVNNVNALYSNCGDWQTYREDKCVKILDKDTLVTFEEALKSCSQVVNNSELLTIHSKEEQVFINEYLFETHKIVGNAWIGLRKIREKFEWTDSSNQQYTNWNNGNPINKSEFNCVQLESATSKWTNKLCDEKNIVVCQKLPEVTLPDLLKQVVKMKEDLKVIKEKLNKTEERLEKSEADLKVTKENLNKTEESFEKSVADFKDAKEKLSKTEDIQQTYCNYFSNKNLSRYQLFTDSRGDIKAFFIPLPLIAMNNEYTFFDSVNLCKNFNSTLIVIESKEKQLILESFLSKIEFKSDIGQNSVWINGERDSSSKWKWLKSNTYITFTNWGTNNPDSGSFNNNICVCTDSTKKGDIRQMV